MRVRQSLYMQNKNSGTNALTMCISGLPLAVGITPSESTEALSCLFNLVKTVLPDGSFFGRGAELGPRFFMTDDSAAEQAALRTMWPL